MMSIFDWFSANAGNILTVATSVVAAAALIVQMTPTQKDDNIVKAIQKVLSFLALQWGTDHTATPPAPPAA